MSIDVSGSQGVKLKPSRFDGVIDFTNGADTDLYVGSLAEGSYFIGLDNADGASAALVELAESSSLDGPWSEILASTAIAVDGVITNKGVKYGTFIRIRVTGDGGDGSLRITACTQ